MDLRSLPRPTGRPRFSQEGRGLAVHTPLGPDALLLQGLTGTEAVSELYRFDLDLLAEVARGDVPFEKVLGQPVSVLLRRTDGEPRQINGIVSRFAQGPQVRGVHGTATFVRYKATVVPRLWLATRRAQSRIFQQQTVPDILKAVLGEVHADPKPVFKLVGRYEPRDYCVQYRETDFAFASRLMEEEGIFYYWTHAAGKHTLVVADHPQGHPDLPAPAGLIYDTDLGGVRPEHRVYGWEKRQEIRTGTHTLWDHCFELPHQSLEASRAVPPTVTVGRVAHDLRAGGADRLEAYDFPGGYAQRFDGVDPGGTDRPADVGKVWQDNERTAKLRAEAEAARALTVAGTSDCRHLTAGHQFSLSGHFNADGKYTLTRVTHRATMGSAYVPAADGEPHYENTFECVPAGLPWRPERATPRPVIGGTQTAEVVGPAGEEIFTDKYGRVKVQFFWDRQGKRDANSSCWVRVSQAHAGKGWGGIDVPR
ncbi:MAG TPA: type VI secretion system tip protein TssI/VgrG, partial [Gemmataceae bacterium]|nr:type VI secretion system tip protein TssI/VgrG [Gemmataceae bacterium]